MSDPVIRVENLGKKYIIGHQQQGRYRYKSLRDVIANGAKSISSRVLNPTQRKLPSPTREEFWALKDICLEIRQGDRVGIIGRNGAGKSTLLKILSRITEPTTGRISIKGRVASLLEVGTGFHPELTGRENIYLNGAILGMSKVEIKRKFDEIVDFAEVERFLDTPVKRYSSGMYVRLAFAVAAHLEPEILIVDEVLAVGDIQFQKKCIGKMEQVGKEGRTVLFVSHNIGVVQALCSRGVFLDQGTIVADDTITTTVRTYLKILDKEVSINLLERTGRKGRGQIRLSKIEISTEENYLSSTLVTGYPALFTFYVTALHSGLSCSFTIYDQYGQPVTNFNSSICSQEDIKAPSMSMKFTCVVDELLLKPGRYRLNAALMSGNDLQDHVEAAAILEVQEGHLRGRSIVGDIGYGSVAIPHRWVVPA